MFHFLDSLKCRSLLCISIILSITEVAFCQSFTVDGINYTIKTVSTVSIAKGKNSSKVVIPDSVEYSDIWYTVSSVESNAFQGCTDITFLSIPSSVTSIATNSFSSCFRIDTLYWSSSVTPSRVTQYCRSSLRCVHLDKKLTRIENNAFSACSLLTSVDIPPEVVYIGSSAFYYCKGLTTISIPQGVETIGNSAFSGCTGLESINLPSRLTTIEIGILSSCTSLTSIDIPSGVTSIGAGAFSKCTSLKTISVPSSVTELGSQAFSNCSNLETVKIEYGLSSIEQNTFDGCSNVKHLYWNTKLSPYYITRYCKYSLESVVLGDSVVKIDNGDFNDCYHLSSVTIPYGITFFNSEAFSGCSSIDTLYWYSGNKNPMGLVEKCHGSLEVVVLGDSVKEIGTWTFKNCTSLKTIRIPSRVTSIGEQAFYNCSSLDSITLPSELTTIGSKAFYQCTSLDSIVIPSKVTSIGGSAFGNCYELSAIILPKGIKSIVGLTFMNCTSLNTITIPEGVESLSCFYGCSNLTTVILPSSLKTIYESAFSGCENLSSIAIPSGVTTIGANAFSGCSALTEIIIPEGVSTIKYNAFENCTSLKTISMASSVTEIGNNVFANCSNVDTLYWNSDLSPYIVSQYCNSNLRIVIFGDSISVIGDEALMNCELITTINIPSGVKNIGSSAFAGCTGLSYMAIPDGVTTIGNSAFSDCNNLNFISIPSTVKSLGNSVFYGDSSIVSITLPSSITEIGYNAFYCCSSLLSVIIYTNSVPLLRDVPYPSIPNNVFSENANGRKVYVFSDLEIQYINTSGWKDYCIDDIEAIPDLTANNAGGGRGNWCTYYNGLADVRMPDDVEIFKASLDGDHVVLTEVNGHVVKRGEGVLLKSPNSSITLLSAPNEFDGDFSENVLKGVDYVTSQEEGKTYYVLSKKGDAFGFYKLDRDVNLGANKAYLTVENANMAPLRSFYSLDGNSGIETGVRVQTVVDNEIWYSIYGVKLNGEPSENGLYIHKGKKVFITDKSVF